MSVVNKVSDLYKNAIKSNRLALLKKVVKLGEKHNCLHSLTTIRISKSNTENTSTDAISFCACCNYYTLIPVLIQIGCNPTRMGSNALMCAAYRGNVESFDELINYTNVDCDVSYGIYQITKLKNDQLKGYFLSKLQERKHALTMSKSEM
jgi:hypothetical protein